MSATQDKPFVIFLMGPTASGKSQLAIDLFRQLPCEIVSVDSALVYRGMDIGTAKPSSALRQHIPHHLMDILDPSECYSAANFCHDAEQKIATIHATGRIPLLVGGTMLYFKALEFGLDTLPQSDVKTREAIDAFAKKHGSLALHKRLQEIDPVSAARIHPNDPQRLQRALEVYELTQRPLSSFHQQDHKPRLDYRILKLALLPESRVILRERIALRFDQMLLDGLIDEVAALCAQPDLHKALPAMRAVGYRQVWEYLEGNIDKTTMRDKAITATRQLAKRQLTWLRSYPHIQPVHTSKDVDAYLQTWLKD